METKYTVTLLVIAVGIGGLILYLNSNNMRGDTTDSHHAESVASYEIYPSDVVKKITNGEDIVLLDVRTNEEYEEVHLENALLLPVQVLSQETLTNIGLGENMKDKEIIIYCRSGGRGKTAYDIMESLGYTNIKSISGGMIHWEEDNYPFTEIGPYMGSRLMTDDTITDESMSGSRITFDRTLHDFGIIPQYGGVVETIFTIKNEGTETLTIGDITTSCSCTRAEVASQSVPAGEKTILTVYFDPDFHEEPLDVFKRTVFIPTNDPTNKEAEVAIQVDIEEGE